MNDQFRAIQPVTVNDSRLDSPLADETAALDVGANNIVACSTTTGTQLLYEGRDLFDRFRVTSRNSAKVSIRATGFGDCIGSKHGGATTHTTLSPAT